MNIQENQLPDYLKSVIQGEINVFNESRSVTVRNEIPDTNEIPIENPTYWFKIPDVICVFVDMLGSTKLSAAHHEKSTAGAYQLFTNTAVKIFHEMDAPYIDVRGDGVFALFNSNQVYRAFVSAVSFKTFADLEFVPRIKQLTSIDIGCHVGIDQKTVLVRKMGLKKKNGRSDRQNEVWAGKPVNMAAKLASLSKHNQLLVSDRYYNNLSDNKARTSCGCPGGVPVDLWKPMDVNANKMFDFDIAYSLESNWCTVHGKKYFDELLALDK